MNKIVRLGVNIDHVATLREVRGTDYPDPLNAAIIAEKAGADGITLHIREDRRHVQVHDLQRLLQDNPDRYVNLEMALDDKMLAIALQYRPKACCLVPEKRQELTTEGGLDVIKQKNRIRDYVTQLSAAGVEVSLFIDPNAQQIEAAAEVGAPVIELHTGEYANLPIQSSQQQQSLQHLKEMVQWAKNCQLVVNAGHGLNYANIMPVANLANLHELNIGHSIVARALFVGFAEAVSEMRKLIP